MTPAAAQTPPTTTLVVDILRVRLWVSTLLLLDEAQVPLGQSLRRPVFDMTTTPATMPVRRSAAPTPTRYEPQIRWVLPLLDPDGECSVSEGVGVLDKAAL